MKIVMLDGYALNPGDLSWEALSALGDLTVYDRTPPELVVGRGAGAEILLSNKAIINSDMMAQLPGLKFIGVVATGYNVVDMDVARERGIIVSNVPEYGTSSVAQFVFALILAHCHRAENHSRLVVEQRAWTSSPDWTFTASAQLELEGKALGIIGFGRIGQQVGVLANAFGMKVLANSTSRRQTAPFHFEWRSVEEIFAQSDVVTLHCPLTASNGEFVNAALLKRMKPSAFLINTARGGLVNESDLADALHSGTLAGAALDVVSREPITADNPLLNAPNIIITPHIAWSTGAARDRLMRETVENVRAFINGSPQNVVS